MIRREQNLMIFSSFPNASNGTTSAYPREELFEIWINFIQKFDGRMPTREEINEFMRKQKNPAGYTVINNLGGKKLAYKCALEEIERRKQKQP